MLNFFDDIANLTGLPMDLINKGYRVYNFGGKSVYIENYKNIINYTNQAIVLKLNKGVLKIQGQDLSIKELNLSTLVINGTINSVEVYWWVY